MKEYKLKLTLTILSAIAFSLVLIITAFIVPLKDDLSLEEKKELARKIIEQKQREQRERMEAASSGGKKLNRIEGIAAGMQNK